MGRSSGICQKSIDTKGTLQELLRNGKSTIEKEADE